MFLLPNPAARKNRAPTLMKIHNLPLFLVALICAFFATATAQTSPASRPPGATGMHPPAISGLPESTPAPQQPLATPTPSPTPGTPYIDILNDKVKLEKGDRLTYRVAEDRGDVIHLTVNDAGDLDVPLIGHVRAAGKTCKQIASEIKPLLEKEYYYKATVIIGLETHSERSIGKFYVMGQVRLPGGIDIPAGETLTVSKAIARAQGFADYSDKEKVKLIRKTEQGANEMIVVDVGAIIDKGLIDKDPPIQPNDIVIVPEVKRFHSKVYVLGRVQNPSGLDMQENEQITVSKAIARCLGFAEYADKEKVKLLRKNVLLPWFTVEDVLNPFGLANKIVSGNQPLCKYLKNIFSSQSLALLADPNSTKQQQKFILIEEFNKAVQGVALDEDRRMDNVKLSSDALRLKAQNPKNEDLIRYNRMLLEDFFAQELKRNRPPEYQMFLVNVAEIMDQGRVDKDPVMEPNDLVIVPESKRTYSKVSVMGQVHYPQTIEMLPGGNLSVSQVIARAGGFSDFANKRKIKLLRRNSLDSYLFAPSDFIKLHHFVKLLRERSDPTSAYLWNALSEPARKILCDSRATPEAQRNVLVTELNRILKGGSIYTPERFCQVKLPPEIMLTVTAQNSAYFFTADDFLDISSLSLKLSVHTDPLVQYLWNQFSSQERRAFELASAATRQQESALLEAVISAFNNILGGPSIYTPRCFEHVEISPEALELMTENPQGEDLVRLNRLLFEDAFPQEIKKNPHNPRDKTLIRVNRRLLEAAYPHDLKRHDEYATIIVDMVKIIDKAEMDKDPIIEPDDLIIVPERWINF